MTFTNRLREAAETGIVWGVKVSLALAVILLVGGWVITDYLQTRAMARSAFEVTQQIRANAARQQQQPRPETK